MAGWQSGYAAACKAVNSGSIPDSASNFRLIKGYNNKNIFKGEKSQARVVELVDTRDLKSLDRNIVPVQVRLRVPCKFINLSKYSYLHIKEKHNEK